MKRLAAAIVAVFPGMLHAAMPETVRVSGDGAGYLGLHAWILTDGTAAMTAPEAADADGYRACTADVPNLGISSHAHWIKLNILNGTQEDHLFLDVDHAEIEFVDVYLRTHGTLKLIGSTGQGRPVSTRNVARPEFLFDLPLAAGDSAMVLLRLASAKQLQVPLKIYGHGEFINAGSVKNLRIGLYMGIMLTLALYNLFVFLSIRDRSYLIYVTYIILISLAQISFWGIFQYYVSPWFPVISVKVSLIFTFSSAIAASEFMKSFISTADRSRRLHAGIKYFYALFGVVLFLYLFLAPSLGYLLAQLAAGLFAGYMFITVWSVWRSGSRPAFFFLVSWSVLLLGIIVFTLKDMGILPYNDVTVLGMPIGSAVEGILLSFGLADKINILRKEKERSQADALRMAQENERIVLEQNTVLERKVSERTKELQESTDHLKRTQSQLVNAEKMASLGQLTAGIAHEINNPVNFISSNIPPLKRDLEDLKQVLDAYREARTKGSGLEAVAELEERIGVDLTVQEVDQILKSMESGAARTSEIVRGLRTFSRLDEDDLKLADVNEGIRSTLVVLGPQLKHAVKVELDLQELPQVECYPGKLNQVIMNILNNAAFAAHKRHVQGGGVVSISSGMDSDGIFIQVQDNGIGMDEAVKQRLFEPFFTTKDVGEGTGLGLSIAMSIMETHHGGILVESKAGEGSTFTLTLPMVQPRAQRA